MLTTILSLFVLSAQADPRLDTRITTEIGFLPLNEAVAKLSPDVHFTVDPAYRDRMVFFAIRDKTLKETMDKVAETVSLTWYRLDGGGYELRQSNAQRAAEEAERDAALRKTLAFIKESLQQYADAGEGKVELRDAQRMNDVKDPTNRLMVTVFQSLKDADWLRVLRNGRQVFSTEPNARQRKLSRAVLTPIRAWAAKPGESPYVRHWQHRPDFFSDEQYDYTDVARVSLNVEDRTEALFIYDKQGRLTWSLTFSIPWPVPVKGHKPSTTPITPRQKRENPWKDYHPTDEMIARTNTPMEELFAAKGDTHFEPLDLLARPLISDIAEQLVACNG